MYKVQFIPEYQVMVSRRSTFTCAYCNFGSTPSPLPPSLKTYRSYLRTAQRLGATQISISAGEEAAKITEVENTARYYGFSDFYEYITELCRLAAEAKGTSPLMPVVNIGAIPFRNLLQLKPYIAGVRLLLETTDKNILETVEKGSPQKNPALRLFALDNIAKLRIPVFTGTRIGLGETEESWIEAAESINAIHEQTGSVHSFSLVPFHPLPFTEMEDHPPVSPQVFIAAIKAVRSVLHKDIKLVAELNDRMDLAAEAVISGAFDFGIVRLASNQKIFIDAPNALEKTRDLLSRMTISLEPRQPITRDFQKNFRVPTSIYQNIRRYNPQLSESKFFPGNEQTPPSGIFLNY